MNSETGDALASRACTSLYGLDLIAAASAAAGRGGTAFSKRSTTWEYASPGLLTSRVTVCVDWSGGAGWVAGTAAAATADELPLPHAARPAAPAAASRPARRAVR